MSYTDNPNHENDRLARMIAAQKRLQETTFETRFKDMDVQERVDYISMNVLALTDELHELLAETSWKPWAKSEFINETKAHGELVDAWHFMMNIMIAIYPWLSAGDIAESLTLAYEKKREVNVQRQEDGYDGQSTKCPKCKRALDDVGATVVGHSDVRGSQEVLVVCVGCATDVTEIYERMKE
jgi:dUTPase-like protein